MILKLFGCKITISFLFAALLSLLLLFDKSGIFALALFAIFVHEAGHIFAMKLQQQMPSEIKMLPAGIIIEKSKKISSYKDEFIIAISGILANVLFVMLFLVLYKYHIAPMLTMSLAIINMLLAAFNLLPVYGLDGYDIFSTLIYRKNAKSKLINIISGATICVILLLGILLIYQYYNPTMLITGIYLLILTLLHIKS